MKEGKVFKRQYTQEYKSDLAVIAAPFSLAGKWYAFSIVGSIARMQAAWDRHVATLTDVIRELWRDQDTENTQLEHDILMRANDRNNAPRLGRELEG